MSKKIKNPEQVKLLMLKKITNFLEGNNGSNLLKYKN